MRGTISWDEKCGFWVVVDEYGTRWDVVEIDGRHANLVSEDSQQYYGAEWCADAGGSDAGDIITRRDGDTYDGVETCYEFSSMSGWSEKDE